MSKDISGAEGFFERFSDYNTDVLGGLQARQCFEMYLKNQRTTSLKPEAIDWGHLKELLEPRIDSSESWASELDPVFAGEVLSFIEDMKQSIVTDSNAALSQDRLYFACRNTPIDGMSPEANREASFILALLYKYNLLLSQPPLLPLDQRKTEAASLDVLL